jgi:hypothetical protein
MCPEDGGSMFLCGYHGVTTYKNKIDSIVTNNESLVYSCVGSLLALPPEFL